MTGPFAVAGGRGKSLRRGGMGVVRDGYRGREFGVAGAGCDFVQEVEYEEQGGVRGRFGIGMDTIWGIQ